MFHYFCIKPKQNNSIESINISIPSNSDFETIKILIEKFSLDNRNLSSSEFLVAKENNNVIGFGRIKKHKNCDEFCSLGVLEEKRLQGIGKMLVEARIKLATQPIYLVCITPDYFKKLGFIIVEKYPNEIKEKLNYCTSVLNVPEKYVVMHFEANVLK